MCLDSKKQLLNQRKFDFWGGIFFRFSEPFPFSAALCGTWYEKVRTPNQIPTYTALTPNIPKKNQIFDKKYRFFNFLKKTFFKKVFALSLIKTLSSKR